MLTLKKYLFDQNNAITAPLMSFISSLLIFLVVMMTSEQLLQYMVHVNLKFVNGFLNIGLAFGLILIYNTTFYTFLTKKELRVLIKSMAFLAAGLFEILSFVVVIFANAGSGAEMMRISLLLSNLNLVLLFMTLILTETVVPNEITSLEKRKLYMMVSVGVIAFFTLISWILKAQMMRSSALSVLGGTGTFMGYLVCIELLFLVILEMRLFYTLQNQNHIRILSAYIFFFVAMAYGSFLNQYGQYSYFLSKFYQAIGVAVYLRYAYNIYIGDPLKNIQQREEQVQLFAKHIETIIKKKTTEVGEVNERFQQELEYARNIQQSLLPNRKLVIKNTHFVSEYFPCDKLSGDFFDIYKIDDENIGMYILDVSGHGISAALMTMFCNNYIRSTERLIMRFRGLKPHKNLAHFFEEFNKMNFPDEMHMVVFFASYNMTTKVLTYCSGGMNVLPFVVSNDGEIQSLEHSEGFAICKLNGIFTPEYRSASIQLKAGDRVVFYTDGLVDKEKNLVFEQQDLEKLMKESLNMPLKQANEKIITHIYPFISNLADDITYFIMEA